ncbi:transcriptional regulator [Actinorhabdospora filicis]|uniref:Transcriptional regulator n=1 Tax=Actinorhabdospora filicis TaxID=1785913 RepID=A0A9W6SIU9_9ACTN|nr:LuxR family transcriptional regulator [Actinorhabdospora filicis]GLZ76622.1 transcriptional regulator [Actinorhabdospora filicis]
MLEPLGITPAAESVYLALLRAPCAGVADLVRAVRAEENTVREALTELTAMGLLRASWREPGVLRPVDPEIGLGALVAREQAEVARRQSLVEEGRAAVARVLAGQVEFRDEGEVECVDGLDAVRARHKELAAESREEILAFDPAPGDHPGGVRVRQVHLDGVRANAAAWALVRGLAENGVEVRTAMSLPVRMSVFDGRRAVVPQAGGALVLSGQGVVTALVTLFEHVWREATPVDVTRTTASGAPTLQQRELLRLWARGATDEKAARQLGVSPRTVRRLSGDLMTRLGAASRFQAGAKALERGWLAAADLA